MTAVIGQRKGGDESLRQDVANPSGLADGLGVLELLEKQKSTEEIDK
jgi:hypothetical protein